MRVPDALTRKVVFYFRTSGFKIPLAENGTSQVCIGLFQ